MKYIKTAIISIVVIVTVLILLDQSNKIKQEKIDKTNLNATNEKSKVTTSYANEPVITSNGLIPIIYDKDGNPIENFDKSQNFILFLIVSLLISLPICFICIWLGKAIKVLPYINLITFGTKKIKW